MKDQVAYNGLSYKNLVSFLRRLILKFNGGVMDDRVFEESIHPTKTMHQVLSDSVARA